MISLAGISAILIQVSEPASRFSARFGVLVSCARCFRSARGMISRFILLVIGNCCFLLFAARWACANATRAANNACRGLSVSERFAGRRDVVIYRACCRWRHIWQGRAIGDCLSRLLPCAYSGRWRRASRRSYRRFSAWPGAIAHAQIARYVAFHLGANCCCFFLPWLLSASVAMMAVSLSRRSSAGCCAGMAMRLRRAYHAY